jgi:sulfur relay (sulfurtransferase) complex TusBCD TusD component (DsrE family)
MELVLVITHPPFGNDVARAGLRLARRMMRLPTVHLTVFLMSDGVYCARSGPQYAEGLYNVEKGLGYNPQQMLAVLDKAEIFACRTEMGERDLGEEDLLDFVSVAGLDDAVDAISTADKVMVF